MNTPTNAELQEQCKYRRDNDDWDRTCDDRCEMNRMIELLLGRVRALEDEDKAAKHDIKRLYESVNCELNRADKAEIELDAALNELSKSIATIKRVSELIDKWAHDNKEVEITLKEMREPETGNEQQFIFNARLRVYQAKECTAELKSALENKDG